MGRQPEPQIARRRLVAVAGVALIALATSASASEFEVKRGDGRSARIAWPLEAVRVDRAPGAVLRVGVAQARRGARTFVVELSRIGSGEPGTRRRVRRGTVRLTVSGPAGTRHELRLSRAGRLVRRGVIRVAARQNNDAAAPPAQAGSPRPDAPTPSAPTPECPANGSVSAVVELDRAEVRAGESLDFAVRNNGNSCLGPVHPKIQHEVAGNWEDVREPAGGYPANSSNYVIRPGEAVRRARTVPGDASPGRYRVLARVDRPQGMAPPQPSAPQDVVAEFAVVG